MPPMLSDLEVYTYAHDAFGDLGRDMAILFGAIGLAESGGDVGAEFDNVAHGYQPEGSPYQYDRGWPQINSVHGFDAERLRTDPAYAAAAGRAVFNRQGFQAWSMFKGGQFRAFLPRMEEAAGAFEAALIAPSPLMPPPFSRDDLMPLFFELYGYSQGVVIEPDGFEADGRRRYRLILR